MFEFNKDLIDYTEKKIQNIAKKLNVDFEIELKNLNEELLIKGLSNSGAYIKIKISFLEKIIGKNFNDYKSIFEESQEIFKKIYSETYLNNKKTEYINILDSICYKFIVDIKETSTFPIDNIKINIDNIKQKKKIELHDFINKLLIENKRKKETNRNIIIKKVIKFIFTSIILGVIVGLIINYITYKFGWNK